LDAHESSRGTGKVERPRAKTARRDPAARRGSDPAPGLPQLALDGAIEAAKLPIKVGANITFRTLDAVTKGLRGR
jgi:hypothetical protein